MLLPCSCCCSAADGDDVPATGSGAAAAAVLQELADLPHASAADLERQREWERHPESWPAHAAIAGDAPVAGGGLQVRGPIGGSSVWLWLWLARWRLRVEGAKAQSQGAAACMSCACMLVPRPMHLCLP